MIKSLDVHSALKLKTSINYAWKITERIGATFSLMLSDIL